eukprot:3538361-Pleurochrysis_carterae.AAC.2
MTSATGGGLLLVRTVSDGLCGLPTCVVYVFYRACGQGVRLECCAAADACGHGVRPKCAAKACAVYITFNRRARLSPAA